MNVTCKMVVLHQNLILLEVHPCGSFWYVAVLFCLLTGNEPTDDGFPDGGCFVNLFRTE